MPVLLPRLFLVALGFFACALLSSNISASPLLRCQIKQGGITQTIDTSPTSDPYRVKTIDINGRFRFKAVVVGHLQQVDYVKLYTYFPAPRQPVLLHEATYLAPMVQTGSAPAALTGLNTVYSPSLERELQYQCTLLEVAP